MRRILLFVFVLCSFAAKAQTNGDFTVKWSDNTSFSSDVIKYNIPQFQQENFYFNDGTKAIFLMLKFPVSAPVDEKSLQLSNLIYENISASQLGDLDAKVIPVAHNPIVDNSKARENFFVAITLAPIVKDGSGFKRLKSFSYTIRTRMSADLPARRDFNTISNSVLANGDWFRFYVEKSGVYKISKSFLQQLGMKLNNVNPQQIKIYGNGGRMLPLPNSIEYPSDLTENAIYFEGESDGVFDGQDYILFYAEGVDNWDQANQTHNNLYSNRSYYYVTVQGGGGKRITPMPSPTNPDTITTIDAFDEYQFHELDLVNFARLGRKWFGEELSSSNEQSFEFEFPNIVAASQVTITVAGAAAAPNSTSMAVKANGTEVGQLIFGAIVPLSGIEGTEDLLTANFPAAQNVTIDVEFNNNGVPSARGYLDYIRLKAKSALKGYNKQFRFQYDAAATTIGTGVYNFTNAVSIAQVWDITDIYNVTGVKNENLPSFSFQADLGSVRKYIAVDKSDYYAPKKESQSKVANQNLKGSIFKNAQNQFQDVDYLIVTPASLNSAAEKLANFHRSYEGLNVKVVNLENIYQEFSSGKQDIAAIRNFVKYIYNNATSDQNRIKYLNLFGDASYDFKDRIPNNTNIVPIFHTIQNNFSLSGTFISDDFFVLMDGNEGNMTANSSGLDIAVGRMLVDGLPQANEMVEKVIEYHDIKSFGRWRNNFVLISDDVDRPEERLLEIGLDDLGEDIVANKPFVNVKKIHSDAYQQETSAGGERYPKVREDFVSALDQGALVFNYFGHGGEDGLAHERILLQDDVKNLTNRYKYPLFVTITCEFTRFDNPYRPTAGEYLYWNPKGGSISLITTTRQITIGTGQSINEAFSEDLYGYGDNNMGSIAEALRTAKISYAANSLMVFYIGDPAVRLAIPKPKIVLTKVNDAPITGPVDDFKALSVMKISGEVRDETGTNLLSDYNGDLAVNIYDKNININTLGNDGQVLGSNLIVLNFNNLGETIFRGNASIGNGLFEFTFVVPRDIRVPLGNGRASFYAKKTNQLLDQTGFNLDIKVGGINENAAVDNMAPTVKLYMNDETFVSGGITNESPILLAFLEDANGINTASGIGHDITAILDGDESNPFILNDYYEADIDNYAKGKLKFPFKDLEKGLHTLTFKAWDVYNNPITAEIQFIVVGDETLTLKNVLNYPNPFVNYTQFWFTHNRPFEPLEVQVQVMTITGKIVWTKNQIVTNDGFLSRDVTWDGKDDFGDRIGKGVYVYKLTVKSTLTNKKTEKFEKLVIL